MNLLIPAIMVSLVLPVAISKMFTTVFIALFLVFNFSQILVERFFISKLVLFVLILPGFMISWYYSNVEMVRFFPFFLLLFLLPYSRVKLEPNLVYYVSFFILLYLVVTQYFIAIAIPYFIEFRETWYPYVGRENPFSYGVLEAVNSSFGRFRAGGIFHNPNVFGCNVVVYFYIFHISRIMMIQKDSTFKGLRLYPVVLVGVAFSLFLSGSRTSMFSFLLYLLLYTYLPYFITRFQVRAGMLGRWLPAIFTMAGVAVLFYLMSERFLQGFSNDGSANVKMSILTDYMMGLLNGGDYLRFFFGGAHNILFDSEWGYWIGAVGVLGTLAILLFYYMVLVNNSMSAPLVLSLIVMGVGNSTIYNLMTGVLILISIILVSNVSANIENGNEIDAVKNGLH